MKFFAVGTNMDEAHLHSWIPSARRLTIASLTGFVLSWNKRSRGGGKLAVSRTGRPDDVIWGVVFEVDARGHRQVEEAQRAAGYLEAGATAVDPAGGGHDVVVYVAPAEMLDDSMVPTRSYRDPIVNAARANGLPADYVNRLASTRVVDS